MRKFYLLVLLLFCPLLHSEEESFVTCDLRGSLGNQLFEIATTLAFSWDHNVRAIFPDLLRTDSSISFNRERFFFRLDTSNHPFPHRYQEGAWNRVETIPFQRDLKLFGYFQSWTYFDHHRDKLLSLFAPSQQLLDNLVQKYQSLIDAKNTVSIHVRTFNANLHKSKWHPFLGLDYYQKAMAFFPKDTLFVVFSDRIHWCKHHFSKLEGEFVFIEGNDSVQDFFLMSLMKQHIIANSSFSWWAAYLNQNPSKTVIAPTYWVHPDLEKQSNDLYPPDWILVSPNLDEPYPEDIVWYETKSLDDLLF